MVEPEIFQEMLLDLLVHSEGPRVRDRISHGEVRGEGGGTNSVNV